MSHDFYPFVENSEADTTEHPMKTSSGDTESQERPGRTDTLAVCSQARIAVYDDEAAAPRVVVIEPQEIRPYLDEITSTVSRLSREQGGSIPFMVIREIVENLIHAYFREPTISILNGGETIRFSDQGPGIGEKQRALEYGTTSATEEMRRYIRGVGSGLPYVDQYMRDRGGTLSIEDNMSSGTVVTISSEMGARREDEKTRERMQETSPGNQEAMSTPAAAIPAQPAFQQPWTAYSGYQQPYPPAGIMWQAGMPAATYPMQATRSSSAAPVMPAQVQQGPEGPSMPGERGMQILSYLTSHDAVGPTNLKQAYGSSQPTWTRELQKLERMGLVRKEKGSQKYQLTEAGRHWLQQGI